MRLCIRASGWKRQEGLLACDSAAGVERDRYEKGGGYLQEEAEEKVRHPTHNRHPRPYDGSRVQVSFSTTRGSPTYRMVKQMMRTGLAWEVFSEFLNADRAYDADENCRLTYKLGSQPNIKQRETHGRGKLFKR